MRKDMAKVLTERPRAGHHHMRSHKWGLKLKWNAEDDYDNYPKRVKMSRRTQYRNDNKKDNDHKSLTDLLGPLLGYLESKVGQLWDDVYSEICQYMDRRSVSGFHLMGHVMDYVNRNCWIGAETGNIYSDGKYGPTRLDTYIYKEFYVHPWTGILMKCPTKPSYHGRPQRKNPDRVFIASTKTGGTDYIRIKGIWYYICWDTPVYDGTSAAMANFELPPKFRDWTKPQNVCLKEKKQLSREELKANGLKNETVRPIRSKPRSRPFGFLYKNQEQRALEAEDWGEKKNAQEDPSKLIARILSRL